MIAILLNIIAIIGLLMLLVVDDEVNSSVLWKVLLVLNIVFLALNITARIGW